ncbi:uncharacterized protein [Clytia hemisphaerica]
MEWSDQVQRFQCHSLNKNSFSSSVWILYEDAGRRYSRRSAFGHCVFIADQVFKNTSNQQRHVFGGDTTRGSTSSFKALANKNKFGFISDESSVSFRNRSLITAACGESIVPSLPLHERRYSQPSDGIDELTSAFQRLSVNGSPPIDPPTAPIVQTAAPIDPPTAPIVQAAAPIEPPAALIAQSTTPVENSLTANEITTAFSSTISDHTTTITTGHALPDFESTDLIDALEQESAEAMGGTHGGGQPLVAGAITNGFSSNEEYYQFLQLMLTAVNQLQQELLMEERAEQAARDARAARALRDLAANENRAQPIRHARRRRRREEMEGLENDPNAAKRRRRL